LRELKEIDEELHATRVLAGSSSKQATVATERAGRAERELERLARISALQRAVQRLAAADGPAHLGDEVDAIAAEAARLASLQTPRLVETFDGAAVVDSSQPESVALAFAPGVVIATPTYIPTQAPAQAPALAPAQAPALTPEQAPALAPAPAPALAPAPASALPQEQAPAIAPAALAPAQALAIALVSAPALATAQAPAPS